MSDILYDYLKWTNEYGNQELVKEKFIQRRIPYELYSELCQSVAEQGLITGVINTRDGYFIPNNTTLTVKGVMLHKGERGGCKKG